MFSYIELVHRVARTIFYYLLQESTHTNSILFAHQNMAAVMKGLKRSSTVAQV